MSHLKTNYFLICGFPFLFYRSIFYIVSIMMLSNFISQCFSFSTSSAIGITSCHGSLNIILVVCRNTPSMDTGNFTYLFSYCLSVRSLPHHYKSLYNKYFPFFTSSYLGLLIKMHFRCGMIWLKSNIVNFIVNFADYSQNTIGGSSNQNYPIWFRLWIFQPVYYFFFWIHLFQLTARDAFNCKLKTKNQSQSTVA